MDACDWAPSGPQAGGPASGQEAELARPEW